LKTANTMISKEDFRKFLDIEKLKYCFECGICTASCSMAELLGKDYNPRALLEEILLNPEEVINSYQLWLCAWCYRCYRRCPQALKVPEIFSFLKSKAVENGHLDPLNVALQKIVKQVPLPTVATLICFHPERAGINKDEILKKMEKMLREYLKEIENKKALTSASRHKIAVIGSGPAGLTVAFELAKEGYNVTVFESLPEVGGMLRKCIPKYRLPRNVLANEIQFLRELGVEIRTGVKIGRDLGFSDLFKEGYKIVFIGSGAHRTKKIKIEGESLKGVVYALDFLWNVNSGTIEEILKKVVIIGGGNVAVDAARTAMELGAEEVTILYRRSREEMPANPWEVKEIEDLGVRIQFLVAPKKIIGVNGKVSAIECVRMQLGEPDETGRRKPIPIEGSEFKQEVDMIILAIGEIPNVEFLPREIELNENGTVWTNPVTMETSLKGVFAGGDVVTGPATVIEAIAAGKRAAESIKKYLKS